MQRSHTWLQGQLFMYCAIKPLFIDCRNGSALLCVLLFIKFDIRNPLYGGVGVVLDAGIFPNKAPRRKSPKTTKAQHAT